MHIRSEHAVTLFWLCLASLAGAQQPLFRTVDIDAGATETVQLSNGKGATVKLISTSQRLDKVRAAVREARLEVEINGARGSRDQRFSGHTFLRELSSAG